MSETIKPCPFCGGQALHEPSLKLIYCHDCGCEGPQAENYIEKWNAAPRPEPARTCATCKWVEAVGNAATCQNKKSFVAMTSLAFGCILHKPREAQP